jgi:uncharacterized protein YdhG (YjbR/CyaY superfamily)
MNPFTYYLNGLQEPAKSRVSEIISMADDILIGAEKVMVYGMPTYRLNKKNVFHVAGYNKHVGMYPGPALITAYLPQLGNYKTSKGTWQIQHNQAVPSSIIQDMLERIMKGSL